MSPDVVRRLVQLAGGGTAALNDLREEKLIGFLRIGRPERAPNREVKNVLKDLKKHKRQVAARNLLRRRELQDLATNTRRNGSNPPFLVLKGADLLHRCFDQPGDREMVDVDILTPPSAVPDLMKAAEKQGFQPRRSMDGQPEITPYRNAVLLRKKNRAGGPTIWFHLHWHPINASYPVPARRDPAFVEELMERAVPLPAPETGDKPDLWGLSAPDLFVHLAEHTLRHVYERWGYLGEMARVAQTGAEQGAEFWQQVGRRGRRWRQGPAVRIAASQLARTGLTGVPDGFFARWKPPERSRLISQFLHCVNAGVRPEGLNLLVYMTQKMGPWDGLKMVFRSVFPDARAAADLDPDITGGTPGRHLRRAMLATARIPKLLAASLLEPRVFT